jgi:hypothetical protein
LRAAYCLGVTTSQLETASAALADLRARLQGKTIAAEDRSNLRLAEAIELDARERRDRMRDYLVAKGYSTDRGVSGIRNALLRGPADHKACIDENHDPVIAACKRRCGPMKTDEESERCDITCLSEACVRARRCWQQFLPF